MSVYLQEFQSKEDVEAAYDCKISDEAEILLAWYGYGSYCGSSLVIYRENGKLYEVNSSHCSCYGLKGTWEPEETTKEALMMRSLYTHPSAYYSYDGEAECGQKFREVVDSL